MDLYMGIIIYITLYTIILVISLTTPFIIRKTVSFGINIPESEYYNQAIKKLRKNYLINNIIFQGIVFLIGLVINILYIETGWLWSTIIIYIQLGIMGITYYIGHKKMKKLKSENKWFVDKVQKVVISTDFRNKKYTVSQSLFLIYFIIITITFLIGNYYYPDMPAKVPMQYDLNGNITNYADKSFLLVLFPPVLQLFCALIFLFVNYTIGKAKQSIDASKPEASVEQNRIFRYTWSCFMYISGLLLMFLFLLMQLNFVSIIKNMQIVAAFIIGFTLIITLGSLYLSIKLGQGGNRIKLNKTTEKNIVNRDDDVNWKLGVFYFNPDDPALFVEKRFGVGWTSNFGRPLTWIYIGLFIVFSAGLIIFSLLID